MYLKTITHPSFIFLALLNGKIDNFRAVANSLPHTRRQPLCECVRQSKATDKKQALELHNGGFKACL